MRHQETFQTPGLSELIVGWVRGKSYLNGRQLLTRTVWDLPSKVRDWALEQARILHSIAFEDGEPSAPVALQPLADSRRARLSHTETVRRRAAVIRGTTVPVSGGFEISVSAPPGQTPSEGRWVAAHEIGHTLFFTIPPPPAVPENLVPDLSVRANARLELLCDALARHLLLPPSSLQSATRALSMEFSFATLEKLATGYGVPLDVFVSALAEEGGLESPMSSLLLLQELPNMITGREVTLRVTAAVRSRLPSRFVPVNVSAYTLGLLSALRLWGSNREASNGEEAIRIQAREIGGKYAKRQVKCHARYRGYSSPNRAYLIALLEFNS